LTGGLSICRRCVNDAPKSSKTYPFLAEQLQFFSRVVEEQVVGEPAAEMVGEAAFALLYFQRATDLIPDSIPGMGLLDDAIIVRIVAYCTQ
jgi:uncharacterized membrane protein YkvA (DUF1232 family)